jgi:hypothetical protein
MKNLVYLQSIKMDGVIRPTTHQNPALRFFDNHTPQPLLIQNNFINQELYKKMQITQPGLQAYFLLFMQEVKRVFNELIGVRK